MKSLLQATDASEREFLSIIDRHGWHVMLVHADETSPGFAYSTGIFQRTASPELIVFGLAQEVAHSLINSYAARIIAGESFAPGARYADFLDEAVLTFIDVTGGDARSRFTTWTSWYYEGYDYPLFQAVWPDKQTNAFPWEPGYHPSNGWYQPLLGPHATFQ